MTLLWHTTLIGSNYEWQQGGKAKWLGLGIKLGLRGDRCYCCDGNSEVEIQSNLNVQVELQ
jgi:hypothetical protein